MLKRFIQFFFLVLIGFWWQSFAWNGRLPRTPRPASMYRYRQTSQFLRFQTKLYNGEGNILSKVVLVVGDMKRPLPQPNDLATISFRFLTADGKGMMYDSAEHSADTEEAEFHSFRVQAQPRQTLAGWELAVAGMRPGERARFIIPADLAFGDQGAPPLVPPNSPLHCELLLVDVTPPVGSRFRPIGAEEGIREEVLQKMQDEEEKRAAIPTSDSISEVSEGMPYNGSLLDTTVLQFTTGFNSTSSGSSVGTKGAPIPPTGPAAAAARNPPLFFDPAKHKLLPNLTVEGSAVSSAYFSGPSSLFVPVEADTFSRDVDRSFRFPLPYTWTEDANVMDIRIPLSSAMNHLRSAGFGLLSTEVAQQLLPYSLTKQDFNVTIR
jgi:hypothetical protein